MKRNRLQRRIQQKFDWDVTGLATYIDEQSDVIIPALVYKAKTLSIIPVMEGVKGSEQIKLMDTTITLQSAATCGRNPLGGTVLTNTLITAVPIKSNIDYCEEDLVDNWGQLGLPAGVRNQREGLAYEDMIIAHQVGKVAQINEVLVWQGDTTSVTPNLNKFDGFKKKFDADALVSNVNTTSITSFTEANIIGILQDVHDALPSPEAGETAKEKVIWVGKEIFDIYLRAVTNGNYYHHDPVNDNDSITLIGTTMRIELTHGLSGQNSIYAGPVELMRAATDLQSDWDDFTINYSLETDKIYVDLKYRLGVNYVYPAEFKKFTLTAS